MPLASVRLARSCIQIKSGYPIAMFHILQCEHFRTGLIAVYLLRWRFLPRTNECFQNVYSPDARTCLRMPLALRSIELVHFHGDVQSAFCTKIPKAVTNSDLSPPNPYSFWKRIASLRNIFTLTLHVPVQKSVYRGLPRLRYRKYPSENQN